MANVPAFQDGYPKPSPPEGSKEEIFNVEEYHSVDKRAREAPKTLIYKYDELINYLTQGLTSDLAKVRSIFVWLSAQPVLTTRFPKVVKGDSPQDWLKRIKFERALYTDFFAVLCRKSGIPCVIIDGHNKGAGYEVGQTELKVTSRWNAVHVEGSWRLINVPWALVTTDGLTDGQWIKVEETGVPVRVKEETKEEVCHELDEFWFLTDPLDFISFCRARDKNWQLLKEPWTPEEFLKAPNFTQDYLQSEWELVTKSVGVLKAEGGKCMIAFNHPRKGKARLEYNLYFNPELSGKQMPDALQLERYVLEVGRLGYKSIITRLPVEGVYRLKLAGVLGGVMTFLGEFRIDCVNVSQAAPFPNTGSAIGFSEEAEEGGLTHPSHEDGVVAVQMGEKVDMSFKKSEGIDIEIVAKLIDANNKMSPEKLGACVHVINTKDDVNVSVTLPATDESNDFGLSIQGRQLNKNDISDLCNYLLTQDCNLKFTEEKKDIEIINSLLESMKGYDIQNILNIMSEAEAAGTLDPLMRNKIESRIEELRKTQRSQFDQLLKAIKGATEPEEIEKGIAKYKDVGGNDPEELKIATAYADFLRALKQEDNLPGLERALNEVIFRKISETGQMQKAAEKLIKYYEKVVYDVYFDRDLSTLVPKLDLVDQSCLTSRFVNEEWYKRAKAVRHHLENMQRVMEALGELGKNDIARLHRTETPHAILHTILTATFVLLGEREDKLKEWSFIQNLLKDKEEEITLRMRERNVDRLSMKYIEASENLVRIYNADVIQQEFGEAAALFLRWSDIKEEITLLQVNTMIEEKRGRAAVHDHQTKAQIQNSFKIREATSQFK